MKLSDPGKLSHYLRLVMRQKGLSLTAVERNCGKKISSSYLSRLLKGTDMNLTITAIRALAEGLSVDPYEIFAAAYGKPSRSARGSQAQRLEPLPLIDAIQKLVLNPHLIDVVQAWAAMSLEDQAKLLPTIQNRRKPDRKRRSDARAPRKKL